MSDLARLGMVVDARGAIIQTDALGVSLGALSATALTTGKSVDYMSRQMGLAQIEALQMNAAMKGSAVSVGGLKAAVVGLGVALGAVWIAHKFIAETIAAQNAMEQLEAAVKSTGGVAGRSVAQLDAFSMALQQTTIYSDEAVKGAQSLLLTFTQIRGVRLDEATQAVADLAARMGGDLQGASIQVGKALNDPILGITALTRVGVSFSESQKEVIKHLAETGRVAEAQALILKELQTEFGGSAAAARNTLGGALAFLKNQFGNLFEISKSGSSSVVAAINAMGEAMPKVRAAMGDFVTNTIIGYNNMAAAIEKAGNWLRAFVDLSHGMTFAIANVQALNRLVEEERLAANAMAVTTVKSTAATIANTAATVDQSKALADAITKQREASEDRVRDAQQAADLAGLDADAQEKLKIVFEAVNAAIRARRDEHKELLPETLKAIEAEERLRFVGLARASALKLEAQAIKDAKEAIEGFTDDISSRLSKSLANAFGKDNPLKGLFETLTKDLLKMWLTNFVFPAAASMNDIADASKGLTPSPWGGRAAAAAGGLGAGYGAGSALYSTSHGAAGNYARGALGGAAAGGATGAAIGTFVIPGLGTAVGAMIGAAAGFIGGIVGVAKAASQSATQMATAQKTLAASMEGIRAVLANDALGQALAQSKTQFDALRQAAEDAYSGGEREAQRNVVLAELNKLEGERIAQIRAEFEAGQRTAQEDARVRLLLAQGHEAEADALAFQLTQERELTEARKQSATAATIAALQEAQAAEAVKRTADLKQAADDAALAAAEKLKEAAEAAARAAADAAEKAAEQARAVEDINVELLNAQGKSGAASDLQFALDQQRRLEAAQKNQSADYVAKLLELQQLQRDSRAATALIDSTTGPSASYGRGASSAQTAVSSTVTERTAYMLVDIGRAQLTTQNRMVNLLERIAGQGGNSLRAINEGLGSGAVAATLFSGSVNR